MPFVRPLAVLLNQAVDGAVDVEIGSLSSRPSSLSKKKKASISAIVAAETIAIQERAQRFLEAKSNPDELAASTPMLTSIAVQFGYLSVQQAIAYRRVVALNMELKKSKSPEKAEETVSACTDTMHLM